MSNNSKKKLLNIATDGGIKLPSNPTKSEINDLIKAKLFESTKRLGNLETMSNYFERIIMATSVADRMSETKRAIRYLYGHRFSNINGFYQNGKTLLTEAAGLGLLEVAQALLIKGADINQPNRDGHTPLMWATLLNRSDVISLMLDRGADVTYISKEGWSAMTLIRDNGDPVSINLIKNALMKRAECQSVLSNDNISSVLNNADMEYLKKMGEKCGIARWDRLDRQVLITSLKQRKIFPVFLPTEVILNIFGFYD